MKTLLLLILLIAPRLNNSKTMVYICDSSNGKKYHLLNDCRGLSHCTHRIIEITLEEAKKRGMALCGYER